MYIVKNQIVKEGEDSYFWCKNPGFDDKLCLMVGTLYKCDKPDCDRLAHVNGVWLVEGTDLTLLQKAINQANSIGEVSEELSATDDGDNFCETCYYKDLKLKSGE